MISAIFLLVLLGGVAFIAINSFYAPGSSDNKFLKWLFFYHLTLSAAYYVYVLFNPSDSKAYFQTTMLAKDWIGLYGTSTTFIKFLAYPFIKYLGFSYEASMALFSFIGFLGFLFFYITFRERIRFRHTLFSVDLLKLIFFLPNLHFWSASLGKGSVIFLGISLFFYGISQLRYRLIPLLIGGIIIYHVRPHILLVMLVSYAIAFMFTTRGISLALRALFLLGASVAFFYIYRDVLTMVGLDEETFLIEGFELSQRAGELTKATSGVEIATYNLPFKLFTFLYRPLFIDAPGGLGLIVSVENVFYLLMTVKIVFNFNGLKYLFSGDFLSRGALLSFLTVSLALAQISGNLGLAMRQKSQVMILFMFVILSFLDHQKLLEWRRIKSRALRKSLKFSS